MHLVLPQRVRMFLDGLARQLGDTISMVAAGVGRLVLTEGDGTRIPCSRLPASIEGYNTSPKSTDNPFLAWDIICRYLSRPGAEGVGFDDAYALIGAPVLSDPVAFRELVPLDTVQDRIGPTCPHRGAARNGSWRRRRGWSERGRNCTWATSLVSPDTRPDNRVIRIVRGPGASLLRLSVYQPLATFPLTSETPWTYQ